MQTLEEILVDVIKQINRLNAKRDNDIDWLCVKALELYKEQRKE